MGSILARFTRFCVETNLIKKWVGGEKMTNIRYVISINISGYVAPEDKGMLGELGSGALNMVKTHHRRHHYRYRLCYSHRCHQSPPQIS